MKHALLPEEVRVAAWLEARGYSIQHEPEHIEGRKPDFWAFLGDNPSTGIWVEAKRVGMESTSIAMSRAVKLLRKFSIPPNLLGEATLEVRGGVREQSVQAVLAMFAREAKKFVGQKVALAFVQNDPALSNVKSMSISGPIPELIWVRGVPENAKAAVPSDVAEFNSDNHSDGVALQLFIEETKNLCYDDTYECALKVDLTPDGRPLRSIGLHTLVASSTASDKIKRHVKEANEQIRNANKYREAPGLVFVIPDEGFVGADEVAQAVYGQLTYTWPADEREEGSLHHGMDGQFRPNKHRNVSGVVLLSGEAAIYFPNPYAHVPLDPDAAVFVGTERTSVQFVDHRRGGQ